MPPHLRRKAESTNGKSAPSIADTEDVRMKLADLGVKVSEPAAAEKTTSATSSKTAWQGRESAPPPSRGGYGQGRGRGRGGRQPAGWNREARWPKAEETRVKDPNRWEPKWFDEESQSERSIDSNWADCGGNEYKAGRPALLNQERGFDLADFDGNMAPPPLDWDARPAFRDPTKIAQIEKWVDGMFEQMGGQCQALDNPDLTSTAELVPR
jgi:hypothetical protein